MYITGGVGSVPKTEGFGKDYELPLDAYAETCAAIGVVRWCHSLLRLKPSSDMADLMERTLLNAVLGGISLDGLRFFYTNPLEAREGDAHREPWHHTPCCYGNLVRFIPEIPELMYLAVPNDLYVNLYAPGCAWARLDGSRTAWEIRTEYLWKGKIDIQIHAERAGSFALHLRIPGWARGTPIPGGLYTGLATDGVGYRAKLNGIPFEGTLIQGYLVIDRRWEDGDTVELEFEMPVRLVKARSEVRSVHGRMAVERGPLVYCAETIDNPELFQVHLGGLDWSESRIGDVVVLSTDAVKSQKERSNLRLIPYFLRDNRGTTGIRVWFPWIESAYSSSNE